MNNKEVTVAVVIAYYNGSRWIERAIVSAVNQSFPAKEIIVVNDGSKEEERDALYALQQTYNFTIIDKENGGQGSARNSGVRSSTSDFICFLDQDDFYIDKHIEILVNAMPTDDSRFGYAYGDCMEADGDGNILFTSMVKRHSSHPKSDIFNLIGNDMFVLPSATLVSKKAFMDIGGFDEQFTGYEDDDLFMRFFRSGYSNYFVDTPVYVWCINYNSTSYSIKMSRSRFRYFKKLCSTFEDDYVRGRFYFRDLMIPRFGPSFMHDIIKISKSNREDRKEVNAIFNEYKEIVWKNKYSPVTYKIKLSIICKLLPVLPLIVLKAAYKFTKHPLTRGTFKKLRRIF
ncbi:glycosyltransferase family 2 protein [Erwinia mallotivora]|uniref:Glycosyl transferase family 2 n=1 Tax=Erwinia mallotivora TaxID=69222 RepID=A0A014LY15_9GAMM|nr:glycosyltransferase family A protein [Erwinia mallotivora]EXU74491.1 glycosyl transferase family 2 [Erwinia mallotivora]